MSGSNGKPQTFKDSNRQHEYMAPPYRFPFREQAFVFQRINIQVG